MFLRVRKVKKGLLKVHFFLVEMEKLATLDKKIFRITHSLYKYGICLYIVIDIKRLTEH